MLWARRTVEQLVFFPKKETKLKSFRQAFKKNFEFIPRVLQTLYPPPIEMFFKSFWSYSHSLYEPTCVVFGRDIASISSVIQ